MIRPTAALAKDYPKVTPACGKCRQQQANSSALVCLPLGSIETAAAAVRLLRATALGPRQALDWPQQTSSAGPFSLHWLLETNCGARDIGHNANIPNSKHEHSWPFQLPIIVRSGPSIYCPPPTDASRTTPKLHVLFSTLFGRGLDITQGPFGTSKTRNTQPFARCVTDLVCVAQVNARALSPPSRKNLRACLNTLAEFRVEVE